MNVPMPEPVGHLHSNGDFCLDCTIDPSEARWPVGLHTTDSLRAYGDARARAALEEAARPNEPCDWSRDVYTLIGQAAIRRGEGEHDMPAYFEDLARRIAAAHCDAAFAARVAEVTKHD